MLYAASEQMPVDDTFFFVGLIVGVLIGALFTAILVGAHFVRREEKVWEEAHIAGWDAHNRHREREL